jgi:hypothetical protein
MAFIYAGDDHSPQLACSPIDPRAYPMITRVIPCHHEGLCRHM